VGLLSPQLVPVVGTPNYDASKNRERDEASALDGHHLVVRHNNQPIVGGSNGWDDGADARSWVEVFFFLFQGGTRLFIPAVIPGISRNPQEPGFKKKGTWFLFCGNV
jgi:hypothetical protein